MKRLLGLEKKKQEKKWERASCSVARGHEPEKAQAVRKVTQPG